MDKLIIMFTITTKITTASFKRKTVLTFKQLLITTIEKPTLTSKVELVTIPIARLQQHKLNIL